MISILRRLILVVEDDPGVARLIREVLNEETNCYMYSVATGEAALTVVETVKPALILLNVNLPGINGLEVYDRLQGSRTGAPIPTLFMTANPNMLEFRRRGFNTVLRTPLAVEELLGRVRVLLESPLAHLPAARGRRYRGRHSGRCRGDSAASA